MNNMLSPISINNAQTDLTMSILNIQKEYQIPAYLMELIISNCLVDVKSCACHELVNSIEHEKIKEDKDNG